MKSIYEPYLLESAWEVCNQVGGIYTVIQTKALFITKRFGDKYCLTGPILGEKPSVEFEPSDDFENPWGKAVLSMRKAGYQVEYGNWLIDGNPKVVLFPISQVIPKLNTIKSNWVKANKMEMSEDPLVAQVMAFGYLNFIFLKHFEKQIKGKFPTIAHYHEWMAGSSIPLMKQKKLSSKIIFTTHATMLGRYLAMNEPNFYRSLSTFDWEIEAKKYGILTQVSIERLAAKNCDIMSTVSQLTDRECQYLLGRKSDKILPNGLNIKRFAALHEFQNLHLDYKKKIQEFVMGHFFSNYTFDLDKTLYFFTAGRYEFVNKGYDLTLEALYRLNKRMQKEDIDMNVVMFYVTRRPFYSINPTVLQLRFYMDEIKDTSESIKKEIGDKLFYAAAQGDGLKMPNIMEFVDEHLRFRLRKTIQRWHTKQLPIVVTHNLKDDVNDEILQGIRRLELYNKPTDKVKIIYHPDFVDSTSPLFKIDYQNFVRGCHLGIFPSYYEPWGYTPAECLANAVPAITSDLSGFGDFAKRNIKKLDENGIDVIRRKSKSFDESVEELAESMYSFVTLKRRERIDLRNKAEALSEQFSWDNLAKYYLQTYELAIDMKPAQTT